MHSLIETIIAFGYVAIFITVFAESGFLLGFFLPGESMLFTVGILASQGYFNIWILVPMTIIAAILGDSFGYWTGKYFGPRLFNRPDSFFFKQEYVTKTENFYKKYGPKTIILARFVPIVRTFAPIMAGVGKMEYKIFIRNNVVGAFIWAGGFLLISYYIGSIIPGIEKYLTPIILGIIFLSLLPIVYEYVIHKKKG
jgi:membrane-associated protein